MLVEARTLVTLLSKPSNTNRSVREDTSIKHDLPKSATRVTKFQEEKNWRGAGRDSFFSRNFVTLEPILRAKIENMISPDYVLCYIPRAMAILGKR